MIISHKYGFIFLKTRKTAGTSVEIALSQYCGPEDIITPISPEDERIRAESGGGPQNYKGWFNPLPELRHASRPEAELSLKHFVRRIRFYNHMPAYKARNRIGERTWQSYFKFAFDRNPWDKSVSHYYWRRRNPDYTLSFDEYVRQRSFCHNAPIYTIDGRLAIDFLGRYESLEEDLRQVCHRLGIPFDGRLPRSKNKTRPTEADYRQMYTQEQRRIIAHEYSKELELTGYRW